MRKLLLPEVLIVLITFLASPEVFASDTRIKSSLRTTADSSAEHTTVKKTRQCLRTKVRSFQSGGLYITIDSDGTEYIIDSKNGLAMIRKNGIVVQTLDLRSTSRLCSSDDQP